MNTPTIASMPAPAPAPTPLKTPAPVAPSWHLQRQFEGQHCNNNHQGQEEAGCIVPGHHPCLARLTVAMGGRHARTLVTATAMATMMKTKREGRRHNDDCRGQKEAGCVARGCCPCPCPTCLVVATRMMAREDIGNGDNHKDKDGDKDCNGNKCWRKTLGPIPMPVFIR
jgi:hypothetical protein